MTMSIASVADIPESALLQMLHEDPMCRAWILPPDYTQPHYRFFDVRLPSLIERQPPLQGDIDLLIVPSNNATESLAYQFKRVKVNGATFLTGQPNKLQEIRKLARQANLLVPLGFHRVYATILLLVDSRTIGGPSPWLNFAPPAIESAIRAEVIGAGFDPSVGVTIIEICQPIEKDFRLAGGSATRILQHGTPLRQLPEVTSAMQRLVTSAA